jgi:heterodisulfide reductase subunit C
MSTSVSDSATVESRLQPGEEAILHREKLLECIQCGTCSASCPTAYAMDYTPRQIIAALRAGQLGKVLRSNTPWLCASCYYCTVRCPAGIEFTEFMYDLKRMAVQRGLYPRGSPNLYRAFTNTVDRYGRSAETELMIRYHLSRLNPLGLIKLAPFGLKMLLRGRFPLLPHRIKGRRDVTKMLKYVEEKGEV